MLLATLNAIFALICGYYAKEALPKGILFFQSGWNILHHRQGAPTSVDEQRQQHEASRFIIGGVLWVLGGLVLAGFALYFGILSLRFTFT